jgi:hypothetical protein
MERGMLSEQHFDIPYDNHHVYWPKRHYHTPLEKRMRMHKGFIIPTRIDYHRDLHSHLTPPEKPSHQMIGHLLDYVGNYHPDDGRTDTIELAIDYFDIRTGDLSTEIADLSRNIVENLRQQLIYIRGEHHGKV